MLIKETRGLSNIIGILLLTAVTLAIVTLLVTIVYINIGAQISESPDAAVKIEPNVVQETVLVTVVRNENVQSFRAGDQEIASNGIINGSSGDNPEPGDFVILEADPSRGPSQLFENRESEVTVVAVMSDGTEQVIATRPYDFT